MKRKYDKVYRFKVTLKGIRPPIWRRIQVPETYTFWDLHVAVQDAMGWTDSHLHHFEIINPTSGLKEEIGIPGDEFSWEMEILPGWKKKIARYFSRGNDKAVYIYDYGDDWNHTVKLEKILPREDEINYPLCSAGKRACPPEDCGGPWGYEDFLEKIMDPNHEEHEEMLEWAGIGFDPKHFNIDEIIFDDPAERRKMAFN
ncbi:MAG: plasmid pRiA4b ORF-3 family protein [Candidatus Aminicenantes bacterium]|nr:plasmid pRiA4b ORF-3 family protein [Candidatus Aminicenantes bacterium]